MIQSDPLRFTFVPDATGLKLENVELQRTFETDKAGLTSIEVRLMADVLAPDGDYVTTTIDLMFCLFHGDSQVGSCDARAVVFDGDGERAAVRIETSAARLDLGADVTAIEIFVERTTIVNAATKSRLERA